MIGVHLFWVFAIAQAHEPFQVEFNTRQYEPSILHSQHQRLRSLLPRGRLKGKVREDFVWPGQLELAKGFNRISGRASYLGNNRYEVISFEALPDKEAFRRLVDKTLEFNGEDADFEDFGAKVTIQGKPRTEEFTYESRTFNPDGTVKETVTNTGEQTLELGKAHIAYVDGLSVGGSEFAFHVSGRSLREDMEIGRHWDWGHLCYPQRLPRDIRMAGIETWARVNDVQLQRRDGERDFTFGLRNALRSIHHEWRERLWLDGELLKWSIIEPTSSAKPWLYNLSLVAVLNTTLAEQIGELRPVPVPQIQCDGTPVCTMTIGARLPEKYRQLLQPLVSTIGSTNSLLQSTALKLLESGRLSGQVVIFLNSDQQLLVNAAGALGTQTLPLPSLANLLGGVVSGDTVQAPLPLLYQGVDLPLMTFADRNSGAIRLSVGRPGAEAPTLPKITDGRNPRGVLLTVSGDLSPLLALPSDHPTSEVVRQLELFHHFFEVPKMTSGKVTKEAQEREATRDRMKRWMPSSGQFVSLRERFSADDDFRFKVEVKSDFRGRVNLSVEVGEGLWAYFRCRTLLRQGRN